MATLSLDHLSIWATDKWISASFLAEMLGLEEPQSYGPFAAIEIGPTQILFGDRPESPDNHHHLAFVVTDDEFDAIMIRLEERGIEFFADPFLTQPGKINHRTGRGVYFRDPDGFGWEAITKTDRGLI